MPGLNVSMPSIPSMPPFNFSLADSSRRDISGHTQYGATGFDFSGWTVNYKNAAPASGATISRPSVADTALATTGQGGIPWLLIIGAVVAIKLLKH